MSKPRFLQSSAFAIDFLIGITDGIMIPLALAAALSNILSNPLTIMLICLLAVLLMGFLMGLSSYFTIVNQAEENVDLIPKMEQSNPNKFARHLQLKEILTQLDIGRDALQKADYETLEYYKHWTKLLEDFHIGTPMPDFKRARKSGGMVGLSFLIGGLLIVVPYIFAGSSITGLQIAVILSLIGLVCVSIFKASYTGISAWKEAIRLVITCLVTAGASFLVFYLLSH